MSWQPPKNIFEIHSFLGLAGYYRRFVKNFSSIASSLTKLTCKGVNFTWDNDCEEAFQLLKTRLTTTPVSIIPGLGVGYAIYCNDSLNGLVCVLMQEGKVVAYGS